MPRQIILSQVTLDSNGLIHMTFEQQITDGELTVVETNVRRIIAPNEDPEQPTKGYTGIDAHDKDVIHGIRAMSAEHPGMVANAEKYVAQQEAERAAMEPPTEPAPEPQPEEEAST